MNSRLISYILLIMFPAFVHAQVLEKRLSGNSWKFRKKNDRSWFSANVPGTVHTDLLTNKKIQDPFYGDNEKQLQWIENEDWEYKTHFFISKTELLQSHIELQFEGLDTYAKVFVNDSLVLATDNMFRVWKVEVKKYVRKGKNKLAIVFESAVRRGKEEAAKLSYTLPGDEKVFTRKAQYQYGWDWGPRFVTCGVWKDVKLIFWNDARILNVRSVQKTLTDSLAQLEFVCEIQSDIDANAYLDIANADEDNSGQITTKIALTKGTHLYNLSYTIKNPQRWWCNGLGFPTMYKFKIQLSYDSRFLDEENIELGLRTIELIQDKDSVGKSFYFKVNGVPVFMKGANYIPSDNFLPRLNRENYFTTIKNAVDANMNMLRVWGGGVYADDAFYDACDKYGILIWQDFMFACAMYPGDNHFVANVAEEVVDQVVRLRNHPCIALWCGNNEVDEGWVNWGWQKQYKYSDKDSSEIAKNNNALFNHFIREMVDTYDGGRQYWPSSPSIGWGHKESLEQGDSHYWGVWWGMEPFENYENKVGRFASEYGFQGMPNINAMYKMGSFGRNKNGNLLSKNYYKSGDFSYQLDSLVIKNHQKHPLGFKTIGTYMERDYNVPKKFEDYIYVSQLLQAEGMKIAIEAHRRAKPYCMGSLYWQLNDCWPVTSWSSVDYFNGWKASHYVVKKCYEPLLLSIKRDNDQFLTYIINDELKIIHRKLFYSLVDFSGKVVWRKVKDISIPANSSAVYDSIRADEFDEFDLKQMVLSVSTVIPKALEESKTLFYFVKPKDLGLQKPVFEVKSSVCNKVQCISISTDVLAKDVYLSIEGESLNLSDNYFDLLPTETRIVYLPENCRVKDLEKKIIVKSLFDTY